jgi:uncharacterized membrane protein YeiH
LAGAATYMLFQHAGTGALPAGVIGFITAFAVRAGAVVFGWNLPGFRGRAPRFE